MADAADIISLPIHRLLSNGGPASAYQLVKRATITGKTYRGLFHVDTVIAAYETHERAEDAIRKLQTAGIDMRTLSIAGKDIHFVEHVSGFYTSGDRMLRWGARGAFWGGVWGLLFDSAMFAIPGIGPVLLAGPLVSWIVAVLEGAIVLGGLSALGAGLVSIGIPRNSVLAYEAAVKTDSYLLMVHGPSKAVAAARETLNGTSHSFCNVHGEDVLSQ